MANQHNPLTTCLNLRSKEMYYEGEGVRDAEHDAEVERLFGPGAPPHYWCQCTQTARGPDQKIAGKTECSVKSRGCFVGIESLA